jgi:Protein of unknown function (DUF1579)
MRRPVQLALWAVCSLLPAACAFSQEKKDQPPRVAADVPGPVHQRLGELVGSWDVAIQYKLGDKVQDGKATCDATMILGGRFLQQNYKSIFQGEPFEVLQILGYDNDKHKTIEVMMDTTGTGLLHNEGTISEDGKVITNLGESRDPTTKKRFKLRTVYTIADRDHFSLEWFRTNDGTAEEKVVTLVHTRKKPD